MKTDIAVYRSNGIWYILQSSNGYNTSLYKAYSWGLSGDLPVPGDFGDGDMKTDIAVYHPPSGLWYIRSSLTGAMTATGFGGTAYTPVN